MILESFRTYIAAQSSITSLLGAAGAIYPEIIPESDSARPAITYNLDNDTDIDLLAGNIAALHMADIETTVWAATVSEAHSIAAQIKSELAGLTGTFGTNTVDHISKQNEFSGFETPTRLHWVRLVFRIAYR